MILIYAVEEEARKSKKNTRKKINAKAKSISKAKQMDGFSKEAPQTKVS
jgi:hypothetical protein